MKLVVITVTVVSFPVRFPRLRVYPELSTSGMKRKNGGIARARHETVLNH